MKKFEMEVKIQRKAQFEEMVEKILNFLRKNFEEDEKIKFLNVPYIFTTKDRNKVAQFVVGLKKLGFAKFERNTLELQNGEWKRANEYELDRIEKINGVSYGYKSLTPSKKYLCAAYITIGKQDDTYIIAIKIIKGWQGYTAKPWNINELKYSFTGVIATIRALREVNDHILNKVEFMKINQNLKQKGVLV